MFPILDFPPRDFLKFDLTIYTYLSLI